MGKISYGQSVYMLIQVIHFYSTAPFYYLMKKNYYVKQVVANGAEEMIHLYLNNILPYS